MTLTASETEQPLLPSSTKECWDETDRAVLVCRQVLDITHDVKSFHFAAEDGGAFTFDPGQFITLELEIEGSPISRCYTISSAPTRPHLLAITVKRVPGGPVSNWLHDNVNPGTRIPALAPLGAFTLTQPIAKKYLFMSAGSGITPMMSMTRTLCDLASDADILFVHNARTPADIIFRRELDAITAVTPNVRVVHMCEADYPSERWMGLRGRLTPAALEAIAPDLAERVVYTCGPAPYMGAVRRLLEESGFDMQNYHEESFSFDSLPRAERAEVVAAEPAAGEKPASGESTGAETSFAVEFVRSG
jgi:ferredoxin-NADP reductase